MQQKNILSSPKNRKIDLFVMFRVQDSDGLAIAVSMTGLGSTKRETISERFIKKTASEMHVEMCCGKRRE